MNVQLEFPTELEIQEIKKNLKGYPTENRVLILSIKGEVKSTNGIILPTVAKEGVPKKGMIIQFGPLGEGYDNYGSIKTGDIVTYGLYAGKEVEMGYLGIDENKYQLTILSLNEILYVENKLNK